MPTETKLRLLIADDHAVVLDGIVSVINNHPNYEVVATATDGKTALTMFNEYLPDIAILDINMPQMNGIATITAILEQHPQAKIIILSAHDEDDYIFRAIQAGALAYAPKASLTDDLLTMIEQVAKGERVLGRDLATKYVRASLTARLSEREVEILAWLAKGKTNAQIGDDLHLSEGTVKIHVHNIIKKLEVRDRTEAVVEGIKRGLITI